MARFLLQVMVVPVSVLLLLHGRIPARSEDDLPHLPDSSTEGDTAGIGTAELSRREQILVQELWLLPAFRCIYLVFRY